LLSGLAAPHNLIFFFAALTSDGCMPAVVFRQRLVQTEPLPRRRRRRVADGLLGDWAADPASFRGAQQVAAARLPMQLTPRRRASGPLASSQSGRVLCHPPRCSGRSRRAAACRLSSVTESPAVDESPFPDAPFADRDPTGCRCARRPVAWAPNGTLPLGGVTPAFLAVRRRLSGALNHAPYTAASPAAPERCVPPPFVDRHPALLFKALSRRRMSSGAPQLDGSVAARPPPLCGPRRGDGVTRPVAPSYTVVREASGRCCRTRSGADADLGCRRVGAPDRPFSVTPVDAIT